MRTPPNAAFIYKPVGHLSRTIASLADWHPLAERGLEVAGCMRDWPVQISTEVTPSWLGNAHSLPSMSRASVARYRSHTSGVPTMSHTGDTVYRIDTVSAPVSPTILKHTVTAHLQHTCVDADDGWISSQPATRAGVLLLVPDEPAKSRTCPFDTSQLCSNSPGRSRPAMIYRIESVPQHSGRPSCPRQPRDDDAIAALRAVGRGGPHDRLTRPICRALTRPPHHVSCT